MLLVYVSLAVKEEEVEADVGSGEDFLWFWKDQREFLIGILKINSKDIKAYEVQFVNKQAFNEDIYI